ncbi:MAG: hypothetical protein AAF657_13310 [Acidobacteriota bacterium]
MMKKRHLASLVWIASIPLLLLPLTSARAETLSPKELKRSQRQVEKALASGQIDKVVETSEKILATLPAKDPRRGAALYVVALAHLAPNAAAEDQATARRYLEELAGQPRHLRHSEVTALRGVFDQLDQARSETATRQAELEEKLAAAEAQRQEAEAEVAGESEASDERVAKLEAQLRRARGDLQRTKAELEKKDEALQKLKDSLVGRAAGSG